MTAMCTLCIIIEGIYMYIYIFFEKYTTSGVCGRKILSRLLFVLTPLHSEKLCKTALKTSKRSVFIKNVKFGYIGQFWFCFHFKKYSWFAWKFNANVCYKTLFVNKITSNLLDHTFTSFTFVHYHTMRGNNKVRQWEKVFILDCTIVINILLYNETFSMIR